jgi:hypothetical protein
LIAKAGAIAAQGFRRRHTVLANKGSVPQQIHLFALTTCIVHGMAEGMGHRLSRNALVFEDKWELFGLINYWLLMREER